VKARRRQFGVRAFTAIWISKNMTDRMLQFFAWEHLPPHLQKISKPFGEMAEKIVEGIPSNPERTAGLRKLLEAKDCIVRAVIYKE
jgi:hypothetical protein